MFKRIAFYVFIAASLAVAIWGYFRLRESKEPSTPVTEHIPANTLCVIECKNSSEFIKQLTHQNLIWNSLLSEESIKRAQNGISYLDSLFKGHSEVENVIDGNSVYWSFFKDGNNTQHLIQFKFKEQSDQKFFKTFFNKVFQKNNTISSFDAFDLTINKEKWLASFNNGIVYFSSDLSLLEKSIHLEKKESIAELKTYQDLVKANGEQNTLIYLNHQLSHLFDRSLFSLQSVFNLELELNEISCNGFTNVDSLSFLNCLKNQASGDIRQFENLPNNTAYIKGLSLSDAKLFYAEWLKQSTEIVSEKIDNAWKALEDSALYPLKNESLENIDGEIVSAGYRINELQSEIISFKIKDSEKANALLKFMSDSVIVCSGLKVFKINSHYNGMFSVFNSENDFSYAYVNDDAVFLFSKANGLQYYFECLGSNNFLGKNPDFMNYAGDNLLQECNFLYYENCDLIKYSNYPRLLNSMELNTGEDVLSKLSLTCKNYQSHLQFRINGTHAKQKEISETDSKSLWSFATDSVIYSNAYIFKNHLTQENELCFQDESGIVYLISSTGNLIWKKKITEKIESTIYTVDIFKNGKLQLLFNTANYIHLLDRNGKYVQGYPVRMPSRITSNITLLDYENTKDYRLLIACADRKIYSYTLYGIKTEGFVPVKTDTEVTLPMHYVRVGASDYLVTADVSGKLYAFSRKGLGRIDFKNKTIEYLKQLYILPGNNLENTKVIYVDDKNNMLNKISLTDKKETLKLGDDLNGFHASFGLVDDDAQTDVLVYGNGALYTYDLFSAKLMESFNEQAVYNDAQLVSTANNDWVVAYDKAGSKIDMINKEGKVISSIQNASRKPLVNNLFKDGKIYVLTINKNKISCQELN
jgi:hypothetical protein